MNKTAIAIIAALLWTAAAVWAGWEWRDRSADLEAAEAARKSAEQALAQSNRVIELERKQAEQAAAIAARYEQEKADVQTEADRVVADLRAGSLKLRNEWAGCETGRLSTAVATAAVADDGADDRAASASRIVRAAADADVQIRGLQALIRSDRQQETLK